MPTPDRPSSRRRLRALASRHWLFGVLFAAGLAVRVLTMCSYWPAFWFLTDSGRYLDASGNLRPASGVNGIGYPALLRLLSPTDSLATVSVLQHLAGLGLGVAIYAFLRRRGVRAWLAALGTAPVLLDSHQVVLEHYVMSDVLFIVLLTSAALLLLWRERPGVLACLVAGVLMSAAVLTRSVGLGVAGILLLVLLVRRAGWKQCGAFALTVAVLVGGYLEWTRQETGKATFSPLQGRYLYSRTAKIADCDRLELTPDQRKLCPSQPLDQRPERGDWYLTFDQNLASYPLSADDFIGGFAKEVIRQQPGDYAWLVLRDTARYLLPGQEVGPAHSCLFGWWVMPVDVRDEGPDLARCKPFLAQPDSFGSAHADPAADQPSALRRALHVYSQRVQTPHLALGLSVLLAVAALVFRPRRPGWRDGLDGFVLVGTGLAMMAASVATSMYEVRYGAPSVVLMAVGGALAAHRLITAGSRSAERVPSPTDEDSGSDRAAPNKVDVETS
ncbi:phospholipid carrier-dependent glycosyltransferase [Streptoalloteichus hindustanus]|uniref:Dolichyl-phosphate-mannose-protein mannosyltransferase n=1 Tax=Streptoalloteichus hindustanus TaxID=2017 RepID=A0A1M5KS30_STRHI|nr:phospholipid carrier-dependent glycosyltransferase [Streptoalloteichus hindustanus]SHG55545.1 Dolichyl-phosphate-mannose-protein mannosyltransferase [Streptoalloteichus hindustanus]